MTDSAGVKIVKADTTKLDKLFAACPEKADLFVCNVAFRVEFYAKEFSKVDTGAQKSGIFTKTSKGSGFSRAAAEARSAAAKRGKIIEPIDMTPDAELGTAYVAPSTEYSIWQELGTSRMKANPFLFPAVEEVAKQVDEIAKQIFGDV